VLIIGDEFVSRFQDVDDSQNLLQKRVVVCSIKSMKTIVDIVKSKMTKSTVAVVISFFKSMLLKFTNDRTAAINPIDVELETRKIFKATEALKLLKPDLKIIWMMPPTIDVDKYNFSKLDKPLPKLLNLQKWVEVTESIKKVLNRRLLYFCCNGDPESNSSDGVTFEDRLYERHWPLLQNYINKTTKIDKRKRDGFENNGRSTPPKIARLGSNVHNVGEKRSSKQDISSHSTVETNQELSMKILDCIKELKKVTGDLAANMVRYIMIFETISLSLLWIIVSVIATFNTL